MRWHYIIDEFAEDGRHLIRGHSKANAHTQNASEGPRADKFTSDNAKGLQLRDPLFEVKRITDHSHNIRRRAPSSANSSIINYYVQMGMGRHGWCVHSQRLFPHVVIIVHACMKLGEIIMNAICTAMHTTGTRCTVGSYTNYKLLRREK
jgi:hypothetical protein